MNHLIVVAHPVAESFTMALARTFAGELEQLGHAHRTHDLYRMGFDPVLRASELDASGTSPTPDSAVLEAQRCLRAADVLTVIYPLWWLSMPAILKGYIDRVFARGFAYEARGGQVHGLLTGKKCVLITLSGAPLAVLAERGRWNAVQLLQDAHIFRSAGFELLDHLHFDRIEPQLSSTIAERYKTRVRSCARQLFPSLPSAA